MDVAVEVDTTTLSLAPRVTDDFVITAMRNLPVGAASGAAVEAAVEFAVGEFAVGVAVADGDGDGDAPTAT
jgi:hypothetical protein